MVERYTATYIIYVHVPTPHHIAKPTLSFLQKTNSMMLYGPAAGNQCHLIICILQQELVLFNLSG